MLDIEYIKQIDKVLEVEDFKLVPPYQNEVVQMNSYTMYVPGGDLWILGEEYSDNKLVYPLYLQRVIEAINNIQGRFSIDQSVLGISVNDHEGNSDWYSIVSDSIDEAKEKAIIYIMDHIKEKV